MDLGEKLKQQILQLNIEQAIKLAEQYKDPQPLIDLIDSGSSELWESEQGREAIKNLSKPARRGRPKSAGIEAKHMKMLCLIYYLIGKGIAAYSDTNAHNACAIVAEHMNMSYETLKELYKKTRTTDLPVLYEAYRKAGERSKHLGGIK